MATKNLTPHAPKKKRGLKKKLVLSMLIVGVFPLAIGLGLAFLLGTKEIQEVSGTSFQALAVETARKVDLVLHDEISRTRLITTNQTIVQALEERRDELVDLDSSIIQQRINTETAKWDKQDPAFLEKLTNNLLANILKESYRGTYQDPGHPIPVVTRSATRGLFLTDLAGRLVATINSQVDYAHREQAWWQGAFHEGIGQPFLENVSYNKRLATYTFTLSLPVMDSLRYQAIGVLHRIYDAKEFFAPSIDLIRFGKTGHVMLIDSHGTVISCPILPTGVRIPDHELISLVTPRHPGWTQAPSDGHGGTTTSIIGFAPLPTASRITDTSTGTAWHMFVWQSSEELFGPIQHLFTWLGVFGLISVFLLIALGAIAATKIVTPIRQLQDTARLIGRGEFQQPIHLKTGDEIEELADEVNRMNTQLEAAFAGLTSEVASKTKEVEYLKESTTQILEGVPDPVIMLDQAIRIQYLNQASKTAFGLEDGNGEGQNFFNFVKGEEKTKQQLQQEFHAFALSCDAKTPHVLPHGEPPVTLLKDPLSPDGSISTTRHKVLEINNRLYLYQLFPIRKLVNDGYLIGLVLRDITEESRLQDQLIQKEKLASLGILTAGIAHELNNPLVGVIGFGEAILEEQDSNQIKDYAKNIVERGRRMATIIQDFTGQARERTKGKQTAIDLNEQLALALKLGQLSDQFPDMSSVTVHTDYQPLPTMQGHPEELRQVFLNVLTNAVHAMKGKGTLSLSTHYANGMIVITIQDSGQGIPQNHLPKVFDPFFTTKKQGEGAGLGLTIVHRILGKYGGRIKIESEMGKGTKCIITIPVNPSVS